MDSAWIPWPSTLPAPLLGRTHQGVPRSEFTVMESGRVRSRPLFTDAIEFIDVGWHFTQDQFEEFEAFFLGTLSNGSLPFGLETTENSLIVERLLSFWDRFSFTHEDNLYAVSATLEVNETEVEAPDPCKIVLTGGFGGGDSLDCYPENLPMTGLSSGSLSGSWSDRPLWISIWCLDTLDTYETDLPMNGLDHDLLWGGPWVDKDLTGV